MVAGWGEDAVDGQRDGIGWDLYPRVNAAPHARAFVLRTDRLAQAPRVRAGTHPALQRSERPAGRCRNPSYIKVIKRQMFGRALFDLLRKRVLLAN
jgi:hypothetical protein